MKRKALIAELEEAGCYLARSRGKHDIYKNPGNGKNAPVPRHKEIAESLCHLIRSELGLKKA